MKRKLVKQGTATLMISLPSKWIKHNHLDKGSEINLEELNNELVITSEEKEIKKEIKIELTDLNESTIRTFITNTYRKGYDRIHVKFKSEQQLSILNDIIKTRLIGFEIIKKTKDSCIVENITEPSEDQFDNIFSKLFLSIEELYEITEQNLEGKKIDYEETEERIQKYDNFCRRIIYKHKISDKDSEFVWSFLTIIIHAQREIYHMNKLLNNTKIPPQIKSLLLESKEMFNLTRKAYLNKDLTQVTKLHQKEKSLIYNKGYKILETNKGKNTIIIYHLINSIRQFYLANSPLTGIILNTSA